VAKIDKSELSEANKQILLFIILIFIFFIFIYYLISKKVSDFISKPIIDLQHGALEVENGNLDYSFGVTSQDEVGQLSGSFNQMVKSIKEARNEIEQKVLEQTKEIKSKSRELADQKDAILNILEDVEKEKDKTERLAEDLKKFKLALENASDQVIITDVEGIVIYGNRATERITGYIPEEAIGKKAGALWRIPMPTEYYKKMWDVIKIQKKTFIGEIQNRRKNGELYTANLSISPVLNNSKEVVYFVGIEHDITHEKEVDKAKTEFVSLASHQLRTPLSSINWYTEMLLNGDAGVINEDQKKYLQEVYAGSQRMVELVNSLLNVSRLDLGTFVINPTPVNVRDMVKNLLNELKSQILEKKQIVREIYADNLPLFSADESLLRMILQNLLSNAVKYTPAGGSIAVNIRVVSGKFMIEISDTGMGIPKAQQDKVFMKLFRADNAKQSETEGTGLGLYIIKSIVDQAGGEVWFESEENKGTTFYVSFPIEGMKKKDGLKQLDM
jgi:PAS domain S-box-containing protein